MDAAVNAGKYVDIIAPPTDDIDYGALAAPDGCRPAYCPALRDGLIIKGRTAVPGGAPQPSAA